MSRPKLAEALLRRMDVDPSLVGDLVEQYAAGRSRLWLWRQALLAVVVGNATSIWKHRLLALRALMVGILTVSMLRAATFVPTQAGLRMFGISVGNYLLETQHETLRFIFMRYHLFDLPLVGADCLIYGLAGWLVARTHRGQRAAMVLLFACFVEAWWAYALIRQFRMAMIVPKMNMYPYIPAVSFVLLAPSIIWAGLWQTSSRSRIAVAEDN